MRKMLAVVLTLLVILSTGVLAEVGGLVISPEMELLAGVLSQTSWIERRGPAGEGNEYFRALQRFFAPYKDHKAVKLAQDLTNRGFTYDAPPAFMVHLGPLPELELAYEYSDYLVGRAGKRERLEEFRLALRDLADTAKFMDFYDQWRPYLDEVVARYTTDFRPELLTAWLEDFFGWSASEFHLILTPSMFPGGGYGATVSTAEGEMLAFQIIREESVSSREPQFPSGPDLEQLTIHELGHSFVNPSLEAYPKRAAKLRPLFKRVEAIMKNQAYTDERTFLNEQVLRGVEVLAAQEIYGEDTAWAVLAYNTRRGFYLTEYVAEQLRYYHANRDQYPTFTDFVPYLYDRLDEYQEENLSFWEKIRGKLPF